jgi:V/A-type H+-transporting ATPase subunit E
MDIATEKILNRILKEANKKAQKILEEAQKKADNIIETRKDSARKKAQKQVNILLKKSENKARIIRERVSTDIKRKASWITLTEKDRLVTNALDEVKKKLFNLQNSSAYIPILQNLIVNAGSALGGGTLDVILNKKDASRSIKINKLEKRITNKTGNKTRLTISKQQTNKIGAILRTKDGKIFVDNTFEAIFKRRERELRLKIAKTLF